MPKISAPVTQVVPTAAPPPPRPIVVYAALGDLVPVETDFPKFTVGVSNSELSRERTPVYRDPLSLHIADLVPGATLEVVGGVNLGDPSSQRVVQVPVPVTANLARGQGLTSMIVLGEQSIARLGVRAGDWIAVRQRGSDGSVSPEFAVQLGKRGPAETSDFANWRDRPALDRTPGNANSVILDESGVPESYEYITTWSANGEPRRKRDWRYRIKPYVDSFAPAVEAHKLCLVPFAAGTYALATTDGQQVRTLVGEKDEARGAIERHTAISLKNLRTQQTTAGAVDAATFAASQLLIQGQPGDAVELVVRDNSGNEVKLHGELPSPGKAGPFSREP